MDFHIGQIFEGEYPPQAADWVDANGGYIEEIETVEGVRRFQIVEVPDPTLEEVKARKLAELETLHRAAEKEAHILSSLGFEIDANDRANRDIAGLLITTEEGESVQFCDYSNIMRTVTRAQLEIMQKEIILNAQSLYAQKWYFRSQIDNAESSLALSNLNFTFYYESFYEAQDSIESE